MPILRDAIDCRAVTKMELERLCALHNIVMPRVSFGLRGRCAGVSYTGKNWVDFNLIMFREHFFDFVENVIPHELCHAWHDQLKLKGWAHGKEWVGLMNRCGLPGAKFHNYCTQGAVSRTGLFRYKCFCIGVGHLVSLELHRTVQERPQAFVCEKCRERFFYVPEPRRVYVRRETGR